MNKKLKLNATKIALLSIVTMFIISANSATVLAACGGGGAFPEAGFSSQTYSTLPYLSNRYAALPRIGGVSLDKAATFLADMSDVKGAYYDQATDRIVIVGIKNTSTTPVFDKDDLAVAVKSVVFQNTLPSVSIDWDSDPSQMVVDYGGPITNTHFGSVLEQSDYRLKQYMGGVNANGSTLSSAVPSYRSVLQRYVNYHATQTSYSESRWWISPQTITLKKDAASSSFVFDQLKMQVQTEPTYAGNDPTWNQAAIDFANDQTANYDQYAQESTTYQQTKELSKIVGVVKWLKDNNIVTDYDWARTYTPAYVATPVKVPKLVSPGLSWSSGNTTYTYSMTGGVNYVTPNTYTADNGEASALKTASQSAAGAAQNNNWVFTQNGQQYTTVAVSASEFRTPGGYTTAVTDLSTAALGDYDLSFSRAYSSLGVAQSGIGAGWSWVPATLNNLQPWNNIPCTVTGGYAGDYPAKVGFEALNGDYQTYTYTCGSGYKADKLQYHSKLLRNSDGSFSVVATDGSYYKFDISMVLLMHRDKNAAGIFYQYDGTPNITRINDYFGHQLTLSRNGQNQIVSVKDWANRMVQYGYDAAGELITVTDPNGGITRYTYDAGGRLATITDRQGRQVLANTYNQENKLATAASNGITASYSYDNTNGVVTATDNNARTYKTFYDANGRTTQQTDPNNNSIFYTYGVENSPLTIKDKRNNSTSYTYDLAGNVTSATYPDGKQMTFAYDASNHMTQISDGRYGVVPKSTFFTYDAAGNTLTKTEAGLVTSSTYDSYGRQLTGTDPLSHTTRYTYDQFGNVLTKTDPIGGVKTWAYDSLGRLITETDQSNKATSYGYDNNNNVLTITDASGTSTNLYSPENKLTKTTLPNGQVAQYIYDLSGNVLNTTDNTNHLTSYGYDAYQNLTTKQDALLHTTQYAYDKLNHRTLSTTPLGKTTAWEYDANGNITKRTDGANRATIYQYDALNRIIKTTYPDATSVSYAYDNRGNLTSATNGSGTITYVYDVYDRATSQTDPHNATIGYVYDAANNLSKITYPDTKTVSYSYDPANRLQTVKDWNSSQTTYSYNANGQVSTKALPNGVSAAYGYDGAKRLSTLQYTKAQQLVTKYAYTRDPSGNVTKEIESSPTTANTYVIFDDALHTGWSKSFSWSSTINLADTTSPSTGTKDISWVANAAWAGLHLRSTTGLIDTTPYNAISFSAKASALGPSIEINLKDVNDNTINPMPVSIGLYGGNPNTAGYKTYTIPLTAFGPAGQKISGFSIEDATGKAEPKLYIDDIKLTNATPSPVTLFSDSLAPSIQDWSWGVANNFSDTTQPYAGTAAIGTTITAGYGGLQLQTENGLVTNGYKSLDFALKYSQAGQVFVVQATNTSGAGIGQAHSLAPYSTGVINGYTLYSVPLADLQAVNAKIFGFIIQDDSGVAQPKVSIDEIAVSPQISSPSTDKQTIFTYDSLGRIVSATYPDHSYAYTYDAAGNMLSNTVDTAPTSSTFNNDNQLTQKGTRTFTYDSQGNQLTDGAKTLIYDYDNRLISYKIPSTSQTVTFKYDATGQRIEKNINGVATFQYVNDLSTGMSRVLVAKNITNSTQVYFVYGADILSQGGAAATSRQYYLNDGLGNVRYVTDSTGTTLQAYRYDPYGNQISGVNTNGYAYQNQEVDQESGLIYLRARYYDPTTGRFVSKDPIEGILADAQTQNGYSYANDNPLNLADPSGQFVVLVIGALLLLWTAYDSYHDVTTCNYTGLGLDAASILPIGRVAKVGKVVFQTEHAMRHFEGAEIAAKTFQSAIETDIKLKGAALPNQDIWRVISVNNQTIEYRAHTLPDGTVNVGTWYPK